MSIIYTSSSTPQTFDELESKLLDKEGGFEGLINKTIRYSILKTQLFEIISVSPVGENTYYEVTYFENGETQVVVAKNADEVRLALKDFYSRKR